MTIAGHIYSPPGNDQPAPEPPAPTLKELKETALAAYREVIAALDDPQRHSPDAVKWEAAHARFRRASAAYLAASEAWSEALLAAGGAECTAVSVPE